MSEKMTKAELEARVAELETRLAEYVPGPVPTAETDPRRDVAEIARDLRGES